MAPKKMAERALCDRSDVLLVVGEVDREYGPVLSTLARLRVSDSIYESLVAGRIPGPARLKRDIHHLTDRTPTLTYAQELARRLTRVARGLP
jgi:hypothetical protein